MIATTFKATQIKVPAQHPDTGSRKYLCPVCSHTRTHKPNDPCLSVTFGKQDSASGQTFHAFNCHHCGFAGAVFPSGIPDSYERITYKPTSYDKPQHNLSKFSLTEEVIDFFKKRGISKEILESAQIKACEKTFSKSRPEHAIMFPFFKNGELVNIQYRNLGGDKDKEYRMITGCQVIYYGFDQIVMDGFVASDTLYICEGLIDALSLRMCGYPFVWSVPNGSPFEEEGKPPIESPKLLFHDDVDAQYVLSKVSKIVFVGDNDHPGRRLVKELATRSGISKCFRVSYPDGCKDINAVLVKYGVQKVIEVLENAERFPVDGIVRLSQLKTDIKSLYTHGVDAGLSTGFANLDRIFRVGRGRLITITGVPESGKSRFVANLLHNLAKLHKIKISMFAPENRPFTNFATKLLQIHTGMPFGNPGDEDRIPEELVDKGIDWLDQYFVFNEGTDRQLDTVLSVWEQQLKAEGTRYGVIDPFNYIIRPDKMDEGSFALMALTKMADWAVKNDFTIFVVVHPTKLAKLNSGDRKGEYPIVSPYSIFGSSHWNNCSDFILSIWRSILYKKPVELHCLKAKQEELGTSNKKCYFEYNVRLGIYTPFYGDVYAKFPALDDEQLPIDEPEPEEPSIFDTEEPRVIINNTRRRKRGANL